MIKHDNKVIVKIYYNGKEISKVFGNKTQLYPVLSSGGGSGDDTSGVWLKVTDTSDNKTYYYKCEEISKVYDDDSQTTLKQITYKTTTKQTETPGENTQIYELINDNIEITGEQYSVDDFVSFDGKSQSEVLTMIPTYTEKILNTNDVQKGFIKVSTTYTENGAITYTEIKKSDVDTSKFSSISKIPDNYVFCYSDYTLDKDYKLYQIILLNVAGTAQYFYYITAGQYERYTYNATFISDNVDDFSGYTNRSLLENAMGGDNWTNNMSKTRDVLYEVYVPNNFYISFYISLNVKSTGETFYDIFAYNAEHYKVISGNELTHKYISDEVLKKISNKIQYNYSLALIKNDLNNIVYKTNCKYILSKEDVQGVKSLYTMYIYTNAVGWKLLTREEWIKYMPYNTDYKMYLSVSSITATGEEFFGLLDKSSDNYDFRVFGYGNYIYVDSGLNRWNFTPPSKYAIITFIFDGTNNQFSAWQNKKQIGTWTNTNTTYSFVKNNSTLYLNAYGKETDYTSEKFYFYEFRIEDKNGNIVKRIVPSDIKTKLYECVSDTYIEPCRTEKSGSLGASTGTNDPENQHKLTDGMGNEFQPYYIIPES